MVPEPVFFLTLSTLKRFSTRWDFTISMDLNFFLFTFALIMHFLQSDLPHITFNFTLISLFSDKWYLSDIKIGVSIWPPIHLSYLGDNCIQNFHLGRYIIGYTVRNLFVKPDFRTYIRRYNSPNENFEYGYPNSNAPLQFYLKLQHCKPHKAVCHPTKSDLFDDVKIFPTVYHRIYCHKCLTLSNKMRHYKI